MWGQAPDPTTQIYPALAFGPPALDAILACVGGAWRGSSGEGTPAWGGNVGVDGMGWGTRYLELRQMG